MRIFCMSAKTNLVIIGCGLGLIFLLGAATPLMVKLIVNGEARGTLSGARQENGQLIGPVRSIAEALGATVVWNEREQTLSLETRSPWISVVHEPSFGVTSPYDFKALGPVLTVRHTLSETQWSSLATADPKEPVLARFEIIDAYSRVSPADFIGNDLPTDYNQGFTVRAVLYWAYFDPEGTPRSSTRIVRVKGPRPGEVGVTQNGPRLQKGRLEIIEYTVAPLDAIPVAPTDVTHPQGTEVDALLLGKAGWKITHQQRLSTCDVTIGNTNNIIPIYDLSATKLPSIKAAVSKCPGWNPGLAGE